MTARITNLTDLGGEKDAMLSDNRVKYFFNNSNYNTELHLCITHYLGKSTKVYDHSFFLSLD